MFKTELKVITVFFILALLHISFHFFGKITMAMFDLMGWIFIVAAGIYFYYIYFKDISPIKKK